MNAGEDDDLKLQRTSAGLLGDLEKRLLRLTRKQKTGAIDQLNRSVKEADVRRCFSLLEPFQEDPQLLDAHLKSLLPPLIDAYLGGLSNNKERQCPKGRIPLSHAICQLLNLFCKIRGEKIIKRFLNNEPRYLEPIVSELEDGVNFKVNEGESLPPSISPWIERYILLLWLSHLMLAPFPLASISALQPAAQARGALHMDLSPQLPGVTLRILAICAPALQSATKERGAAANLLVRLCVRHDMQQLGLLQSLTEWSLLHFSKFSSHVPDIHQYLGQLTFLSGLVAAAGVEALAQFLPSIYQACQSIANREDLEQIRSSAVARKLIIKILRNIVVLCLQVDAQIHGLDAMTLLEEVVEHLLGALGDSDTLVRYAASKAFKVITAKLEPEMAEEIVEAILGSLNENVYWQGTKRNTNGVNALRWHGLTLTLSQLLYGRAVSTTQLPEILNALLLALSFEQRSATGGSLGANVRDAACFGIWALSRRYHTEELLAVDTSTIRASGHNKDQRVPQLLAIELLVVACLDPAGNIRRGSSAALQELIGRHPNLIEEGIPLVQIVDFHAVGLRERAMCDVAIRASSLWTVYWDAFFRNLLTWRGTGSHDASSRIWAARSIGLLSNSQDPKVISRMANETCAALKSLSPRQVEERHGILLSLSSIVDQTRLHDGRVRDGTAHEFLGLWGLLDDALKLEERSFTSPAMRPEYTTSAICAFLGAMSTITYVSGNSGHDQVPTKEIIRLLNLSLSRSEDSILEKIPGTTRAILQLLAPANRNDQLRNWLEKLEASQSGLRTSGHAIGLGAAFISLQEHGDDEETKSNQDLRSRIIQALGARCTSAVAIEARSVALKAIDVLLEGQLRSQITLSSSDNNELASSLHTALNDYTITERGDVGSTVRYQALTTVSTAWAMDLLEGTTVSEAVDADVLRLSLEKLDKLRIRAAQIREQHAHGRLRAFLSNPGEIPASYQYFTDVLKGLSRSTPEAVEEAVCLGFASSAGMGSESLVQNSRAALLDVLDAMPTSATRDTQTYSLLDFAQCLIRLLKNNINLERALLPLMEVLAFLLDMQIIHRLIPTSFNFRVLLSLTQKAHFKSTHLLKLQLAMDIYRGLGTIETTRADTITKLISMLLHPFPVIRISSAETLWLLTQGEGLKECDWSLPPKSLKDAVGKVKSSVCN